MINTRYICLEGCEGVGKTTQTQRLADYLHDQGYKVLQTKEPGSPLSPLTMTLRNIMLNAKFDSQLTVSARELISQAIRSIHLESVIIPAIGQYDFIIQDRGILSGLAYGSACTSNSMWVEALTHSIMPLALPDPYLLYNDVLYLVGDLNQGLKTAASSKQEFEDGDAIEMKGLPFMQEVNKNMLMYAERFKTKTINVDGKSIDDVFNDIIVALRIGG